MTQESEHCYAGVDLGGTKIALALGNAAGRICGKRTFATEAERGPEAVLGSIVEELDLLENATGLRAESIGIGLPGLVNRVAGTSLFLPNLSGNWRGIPVASILQKRPSRPVFLLNDARMAALGEYTFGKWGLENLIVLTLGTGIGGGIVMKGKLLLGRFGGAGEIGHQTLQEDGPLCGCGNRGCLEALAGGLALQARGVDPRSEAHDEAARGAIEQAARWIGIGIANTITITGIERVVLTGGLTGLGSLLLDPIRATVRDRIRMFPADGIEISFSRLGEDVAVLGGIALAAQCTAEYAQRIAEAAAEERFV